MIRAASIALAILAIPAPILAAPKVVTDIAPIHSITARVMAGVGEPGLVLPPGASAHGYALRPSEARRVQEADLVVWVGPDLTPWLADPIAALAPNAEVLRLEDAPGMELLGVREGGPFEPDEHEHGAPEQGHDERTAGPHDGHLWLDPRNAVAAAHAIAAALSAMDPAAAATYTANAEAFDDEMNALTQTLSDGLVPVRGRPFLVFHDAYQYFEHRFGIPAAGSVALQDGLAPGTARVTALRDRVRSEGIVCAFAEPQFEPKLLATIVEGSGVRTGVLDPLGAALPPGPELYPTLLTAMAESLEACLGDG